MTEQPRGSAEGHGSNQGWRVGREEGGRRWSGWRVKGEGEGEGKMEVVVMVVVMVRVEVEVEVGLGGV